MKIKYIKLVNYKRLYNGLGITEFEQEFDLNQKFVRIEAPNGSGKSTLINALSPLPDAAGEIIPGSGSGLKKIEIVDKDILYVIEYNYRFTSDRHVTSATILKCLPNGEIVDLNPSTNVSFARDVIYDIFGLDANFEILTQLNGYSDKSLATMKPAERKKFVGFILSNLQVYNNIYKSLSKRSTIFKGLLNSITTKIDQIGASPDMLVQTIKQLESALIELNKNKEELLVSINKVNLSQDAYNENEKKKETCKGLEAFIARSSVRLEQFQDILKKSLTELQDIYSVKDTESISGLLAESVNELAVLEKYNVTLTSKIESLKNRLRLLSNTKTFIEASLDYAQYKDYLKMQTEQVKERCKEDNRALELEYPHIAEDSLLFVSNQINDLIRLISKDVETLNLQEVNLLGRQTERSIALVSALGAYNPADIISEKHKMYDQMVKNVKQKKDYKSVYYELDDLDNTIMNVNEFIKVNLIYSRILNNVEVFATHKGINVYQLARLTITFEKGADGVYRFVKNNFNMYEALKYYDACVQYELNTKKIQIQEEYEMKSKLKGESAYTKLQEVLTEIDDVKTQLHSAELEFNKLIPDIAIVEAKKKALEVADKAYKDYYELASKVDRAMNEIELIRPTIVDTGELSRLQTSLGIVEEMIRTKNKELYDRKFALDTMIKYEDELEDYVGRCDYIDILKRYCSPNTGIQTIFIDLYMNRILRIANELLQYLFNGQFVIQPFIINENEFRVPIQGDGLLVDDISSLSASQIAMVNMCISFALVFHSSSKYNIIKLDEVDSALDHENRVQYPQMLNQMMDLLGCEQCFMVSHNTEFDDSNMFHVRLGKQ